MMKKHHLLLVLLLLGVAAFFLNDARELRNRESRARGELKLLRDAAKRSPGAAASSALSPGNRGSRPPAIDPKGFMAELMGILQGGPGGDSKELMTEFAERYEKQLASAPLAKLKEICGLLEKEFPLDQEGSEQARRIWLGVLGMASRADPAWAFAELDRAASATKAPIEAVLGNFKSWASRDEAPMSRSYAAALQKWLDAAQADGRIGPDHPLATELRADIAAAQGDRSSAVIQISRLPGQSQRKAAIDHVRGLQTPEERQQAVEELGALLDNRVFPHVVRSLADQVGFDAAREILGSVSLAPEKHDVAAATIASAGIGPETRDRAAWLLENLRTEDPEALGLFSSSWARGNHAEAANWINTLPPGPHRDAALQGYIPVAAGIDGASAMDWALTVTDSLLRNRMYSEAHGKWAQVDPEQADGYRKSHPLDPEALEAASD
jgi:hypothetical protein